MTNRSTATAVALSATPAQVAHARRLLLQDIRGKWGKFTEQELTDLESNDDLVGKLVAKYGVEKAAARRDVDAMRKGRSI